MFKTFQTWKRGRSMMAKQEGARAFRVLPWDDAKDLNGNHLEAAMAFLRRFKWSGSWIPGELPPVGGATVVVWVTQDNRIGGLPTLRGQLDQDGWGFFVAPWDA